MLFDTDVLIWVFRGNEKAARVVEKESDRKVSVVTYMELLQGARHKGESADIGKFLAGMGFEIVPLSENIGHRALVYVEEYALSNGIRMADAVIAATAVENGMKLCTGNHRHYKIIRDLECVPFRP